MIDPLAEQLKDEQKRSHDLTNRVMVLEADKEELLMFIESLSDATGPYTYLEGSLVVLDSRKLASKFRGE